MGSDFLAPLLLDTLPMGFGAEAHGWVNQSLCIRSAGIIRML